MKQNIEELRKKYMDNPPEGMTSKDIRLMSEDELLDMDYFLNDDELDDDFGEEGFFISSKPTFVCLLCPPLCGPFSIQESAAGGLSYKVKKRRRLLRL